MPALVAVVRVDVFDGAGGQRRSRSSPWPSVMPGFLLSTKQSMGESSGSNPVTKTNMVNIAQHKLISKI